MPETPSERVPLLGATVEIAVTSPLPFTVTTGIASVPPKVPTPELTVANVPIPVTLPVPSNDPLVYVKSPVIATVLPVASRVVELAKPVRSPTKPEVAVIIPDALIPDALIVTPEPTTTLVAVALPNAGVTRVGVSANTRAPEPVSSVTADIKFELDGVIRKVEIPAASPEIPEETGSPVQLVNVPELGVPNTGVTNVGEVANTRAPEPVSSVTAVAKFALDGVVRKVEIPAASPEIPVETGNPVQLLRVPELGVPSTGVVNVGDVRVLFVKVSVEDIVTIFTPSIVTTPALPLASVVSFECPSSIEPVIFALPTT